MKSTLRLLNPTILKWAYVGSASLLLDISVFSLTFRILSSVLLANLLAAVISTSFNYSAHLFWTFESKTSHKESLAKYLFNILALWLVSSTIISVLVNSGFGPVNSKIISLLIVLPLNYFTLSKFVYREKSKF